MEIETTSQHGRTSERHRSSLSPEPSSSSSASRGSTPKTSATQPLNFLKRKALSSPTDTYKGFISASDEASESFNPHDTQIPSRTIPPGTGSSAEGLSSDFMMTAELNTLHLFNQSGSEDDEFEFEVPDMKFSFASRGPLEPQPRSTYPESHPSTSMKYDTSIFGLTPLQFQARNKVAGIKPRKRRRNIASQSCLKCHTSKRECDGKRPCQRCILLGLAVLCVYETDGPALMDDPMIDGLTPFTKRISEPERALRAGKPGLRTLMDPTIDEVTRLRERISELEELLQSASHSSREPFQPLPSSLYHLPSDFYLEPPKQASDSPLKLHHTSGIDARSSFSKPVYPLPSFVGFTSLSPSTSSSISQASTGPALNLHRLLSYHIAQPDLFLHFDVAFPTHDIEYRQNSSCSGRQTPPCDADLDKPAADKELTKMIINFQCNLLQWGISVKRDEGIRVRDVFEAIYSAFDIPLTPYEKSLIPLRLRAGCEEAFRLRCNLAPVLPIAQQRQGWKRVDALLHETLFRGLTQSKSGGDWTLNLSWTMLRATQNSRQNSLADLYVADRLPSPLKPGLETIAPYSPLEQPGSLIEYPPTYLNQNSNVPPNYSNNDLFNLPLSAAFVPATGVMFPSQGACRICNFAWLNATLQHGTLCTLLNNIPPLIPDASSRDYTWAFFCRFVPLCASFDSPGRGPLRMIKLGDGRARLIERLEVDLENPKNTMSWLRGPSGAGKSVIAYTLASRCRQKDRLAGSFFFSRRHANCRSAHSVVLALAYQLGLSQPQAKEIIIAALDSDPGIISPSRDLREQFARLLVEPLEAVDWLSPSRVFVIDAMDQCQDYAPELISLLTRLLSHLVNVGLHIFFTSRDDVEGVLIKRHFLPIISDIALDRTDTIQDIRSYLFQSFDKIHKCHRLQCRKPWPPEEVLNRLVDRVGPSFITGSVIVKFVGSLDHDPADRMDHINHIPFNPSLPSEPSVDNFYKSIISTADDLEEAYLHLTIVANLAGMLSCSHLDNLLNRGSKQKFDMSFVLSQLSPLVHIPDGHDSAVQFCHESLCDFLSDPLRCGEQFISQALVHRLLAYSSLSVMIKELPDDGDFHLSLLVTEQSRSAFDNADVLSSAIYSPPEPLSFLSTLWHITQRQHTGLQADSRTAFALQYFCRTWQILQHLDLSVVDTMPAFRFLANIRSLPVLLTFPIFLAFESPRNGDTLGPSTLEYEPRIDALDAVAEVVNNVYALKERCRTDSNALHYACAHWAYHLSLAEWDDELRSIFTIFMEEKLQQWFVKAWCLQDLETCLWTLCEVRELYLTANPPIRFDLDAYAANTKTGDEVAEAARPSSPPVSLVPVSIMTDTPHTSEPHLDPLADQSAPSNRLFSAVDPAAHSPEETFQCMWRGPLGSQLCNDRVRVHDLSVHLRAIHGIRGKDNRRISCQWDSCNVVLMQSNLLRHLRTHLGILFGCDYCSKMFSRKDTLNKHRQTCAHRMAS